MVTKKLNMNLGDYWKESENQSSFFIKFATRNGFDPLVPANWQSISTHQLLQVKVFKKHTKQIIKIQTSKEKKNMKEVENLVTLAIGSWICVGTSQQQHHSSFSSFLHSTTM